MKALLLRAGTPMLLLIGTPAYAQTTGEPADREILVTAPGGNIDAEDGDTVSLAEINLGPRPDLVAALQRGVPGLLVSEAQGNPWQASITWHGYSLSAIQGTEQGLAVYLDGIRFNQPFGDILPLDLVPEAALVAAELREASPVYGRNALGGALLLTSASGADLPGLRAKTHGDSTGGYGASASYGYDAGNVQALVVAEAIQSPGWRKYSPSRLARFYGAGDYRADSWGLGLRVLAADTRLTGNGVSPVELLDADYSAVFTRPDEARSRFLRVSAIPYYRTGDTSRVEMTIHSQWLKRNSVNGDLADFGACDGNSAQLCVGNEDDGFDEVLRDPSGAAIMRDPEIGTYAVRNLGRESTSSSGAGLQWLDEVFTENGPRRLAFGAVWERASTHFRAQAQLSELQNDRNVTSVGPVLSSDRDSITPVDVAVRLQDISAYASASLPLTPRMSVELGLRWSRNSVRLDDRLGVALDGNHSFNGLNPSGEIDYQISDGIGLSAGYARTSRSPTPAELSCADPEAPCALANFFVADPPLKQVVAGLWHMGLQDKNGPFKWRLSLWRSDSKDDIRHVASEVRGRAYFVNLGRSRRQGIDASAEWRRDRWKFSLQYAFVDARFREEFSISSPANPLADDDGKLTVSIGDRLPNMPHHAGNFEVGYGGEGWSLNGAFRARSSQFLVGDEGNQNPPVPGYWTADLGARAELLPNLEIVAQIENLFDRRFATFGTFAEVDDIDLSEAQDANDPRAYAPGAPRRLSIGLDVKF